MEQAKAAGLGLVGLARVLGVPVPEGLQDDDEDDGGKGGRGSPGRGIKKGVDGGPTEGALGEGEGQGQEMGSRGEGASTETKEQILPSRDGVTSARPKSRLGGAEAPSTQEAAAQLPDAASHALEALIGNAFGSSPEKMPEPGPGHGRRRASRRRSTHGASGAGGGGSRGGASPVQVQGGGKRSSMAAGPKTGTGTQNAGRGQAGSHDTAQHQH